MIKDLTTTAAALYDGGWRVNDRDDLQAAHQLSDSDTDAICAALKDIATENGRYTVIGTPLHGSQEYGSSDDLREIVKLRARHEVTDCTCECTIVRDNETNQLLTIYELYDRYEAAGINSAAHWALRLEGQQAARREATK